MTTVAFRFTPGALPSPPDPRDWQLSKVYAAPEMLPARYSLRDKCGPVRDQGPYGTCVGQAAAAVKVVQEDSNFPGLGFDFSPLYVYAQCKRRDGIPAQEGTYPRVAMQVLKELGCCLEQSWPYSGMASPPPEPPPLVDTEAAGFKVGGYAAANTAREVKSAITAGNPVLGALLVCESMIEDVGADGMVGMPAGRLLGGHAVAVVGYDDLLSWRQHVGFFEVRNSWGTSWGDGGYCWIPYDFFNGVADLGYRFWAESWTSVDVITPPIGAHKVELWIGKDVAKVDGREVKLSQSAVVDPATGRTLLPVRFLAEQFGYSVDWDRWERKVTLTRIDRG